MSRLYINASFGTVVLEASVPKRLITLCLRVSEGDYLQKSWQLLVC